MADKELARLKRAVKRLVRAAINESWKGGGDPADVPAINLEMRRAKEEYKAALEEVQRAITT